MLSIFHLKDINAWLKLLFKTNNYFISFFSRIIHDRNSKQFESETYLTKKAQTTIFKTML